MGRIEYDDNLKAVARYEAARKRQAELKDDTGHSDALMFNRRRNFMLVAQRIPTRLPNPRPFSGRLRAWVLTCLVACVAGVLGAAQTDRWADQAARLRTGDLLPLDPEVRSATLPNGLRYYVRSNATPADRAELRLVMRVGSVLEDDDQQGYAHLVEHVAFRGTAHFPDRGLQTYFGALGLRLGADLNAATGFEHTTYRLSVPATDPAVLDRSLLVLRDWLTDISFDAGAVDAESRIVVEEWRQRTEGAARIARAALAVVAPGTRHVVRHPIGDVERLRQVDHSRLRQFYAEWYRPDLASVIVVGAVDAAAAESLVRKHFAPIARPAPPRPRPDFAIPARSAERVHVIASDAAFIPTIEIHSVIDAAGGTLAAWRERLVGQVLTHAVSARLSERARETGSPIASGGMHRQAFVSASHDAVLLSALVANAAVEPALRVLAAEAARVERFGITVAEFERARTVLMRQFERRSAQASTRDSSTFAEAFVRHASGSASALHPHLELALARRSFADLTLADIGQMARTWLAPGRRTIVVTVPPAMGTAISENALLAAVNRAAADVAPYVERERSAALMEATPNPGAIVSEQTSATTGITEWTLENGARVVLKPTRFKADEVLVHATSAGGSSLADSSSFESAAEAAAIVGAGGAGALSAVDLERVLAGRPVRATPFITLYEHGLRGSASPVDLEALFQLIHLRFTAPRADPDGVRALSAQVRALMPAFTDSPAGRFLAALTAVTTGDHPRTRLPDVARLERWDVEAALAFYRARFADASAFTFVFVGALDPVTTRPFVERYLASLPSLGRREVSRDVGIRRPAGVMEKRVAAPATETSARTAIVFSGPMSFEPDRIVAFEAARAIFGSLLLGRLRQQMGATYSVATAGTLNRAPVPECVIQVDYASEPARQVALMGEVFRLVQIMRAAPPAQAALDTLKSGLIRAFEANSQRNDFLIDRLSKAYQFGDDPAAIWSEPQSIRSVTPAMVQEVFATCVHPSRNAVVLMAPGGL
jgi:zinc protease